VRGPFACGSTRGSTDHPRIADGAPSPDMHTLIIGQEVTGIPAYH
jgi:hypothetical protein